MFDIFDILNVLVNVTENVFMDYTDCDKGIQLSYMISFGVTI